MKMIVTIGKEKGKRLLRKAIAEFEKNGYVEVAAVSSTGIERIHALGQKLANELKKPIEADPRQDEIKINDTEYRAGIVVKYFVSEKQR
jgi:hypothetical protein